MGVRGRSPLMGKSSKNLWKFFMQYYKTLTNFQEFQEIFSGFGQKYNNNRKSYPIKWF